MALTIIIDGNSLMYRGYYATAYGNIMRTTKGVYTNALYSFINMLQKIKSTYNPTHMMVAFDKGKKTFRHQLDPTYKATRSKTPDELIMQMPLVKEYLELSGYLTLEADDYEADDLVGSYSKMASLYSDVLVISGDKDLLQLVDSKITVLLTKKGITEIEDYTEENFVEKMEFSPSQIVDYKGLVGDSSDNISGVKGIGPVKAISLIKQYQTVENIYLHLEEITGKTHELLKEGQEAAFRSKHLATIISNIPDLVPFEKMAIQSPNIMEIRQFFEEMEFHSLLKKIEKNVDLFSPEPSVIKKEDPLGEFRISFSESELIDFLKSFHGEIHISLITDENYHKSAVKEINIVSPGMKKAFQLSEFLLLNSEFPSLLNDRKISVIDGKQVKGIFLRYGINLKMEQIEFDFYLANYLINPNWVSGEITSILSHYQQFELDRIEYSSPESIKTLYQLICVGLVKQQVIDKLKEQNQEGLLTDVEIPLSFVLAKMERNGFKIDKQRLLDLGKKFQGEMNQYEKNVFDLAGESFNLNSPKQLGVILFEKMGIAKGKKTKTGYSTSADVLEELKNDHPIVSHILEYRKYAKLMSTYVTGLLNEVANDGKVHTIFKQYLTQTGRLSSIEPNIQNIPVRTSEGKEIRSAFVSSFTNGVIVSADYSQIELRVLAEMAQATQMIEDFNNGLDLHSATAAKIYNVSYNEVTKEMRQSAKAINFGIVYGMSDWGLSESLGIRVSEANFFIAKYFSVYPEIKTYLEKLITYATTNGYSLTYFGRRRYIQELASSNSSLRKFGERTSMNAPIQGTAADIIKIAMIRVDQAMTSKSLKSLLVAQVHDELVIDCLPDEIETIKTILRSEMEKFDFTVKMKVDISIKENWDLKS